MTDTIVVNGGWGATFFGGLLPDVMSKPWLSGSSRGWSPVLPIRDGAGDGRVRLEGRRRNVFILFDPDEVIAGFWSERYQGVRERRGAGQPDGR